MVRKLKFHEEKLLKKVDFMNWPVDNNLHEAKVMRKFHLRKREDYTKWVRLLGIRLSSIAFISVFLRLIDITSYHEPYESWRSVSVKLMQKNHSARRWVAHFWRNCMCLDWYRQNGTWTMRSIFRLAVFVDDDYLLLWSEVSICAHSFYSTNISRLIDFISFLFHR